MATEIHTVRIQAPLERVYALYTSLETIPRWFPQARAVDNITASMTTPGARYTIRFNGRPDAHEEVLEVMENVLHRRKFVQAQGSVGAWGHALIRFRAVQGGTEVEENVEFGFLPGFLAPLLSALMGRQARAAIRTELDCFKVFAEREAGQNPKPDPPGEAAKQSSSLSAQA